VDGLLGRRVSAVIAPRQMIWPVAGSSTNTITEPSVTRRSRGSSDAAGGCGLLVMSTSSGLGALNRGAVEVTYFRVPATW
jgi:hypothetical protein